MNSNIVKFIAKHDYCSELVNAYLVAYGGRPAMMLQPLDYKNGDVTVNSITSIIRQLFPNLYFTLTKQGTIISLNEISSIDNTSTESFGKILGYIEPANLFTIERNYSLQVNAYTCDNVKINIYGMVSSKIWYDEASRQKQEFMNAFKSSPLKDFIVDITFDFKTTYLPFDIALSLIYENEINDDMMIQFKNYLRNFNVTNSQWDKFEYKHKPCLYHKGIMITLMLIIDYYFYVIFYNTKINERNLKIFHDIIMKMLKEPHNEYKTYIATNKNIQLLPSGLAYKTIIQNFYKLNPLSYDLSKFDVVLREMFEELDDCIDWIYDY